MQRSRQEAILQRGQRHPPLPLISMWLSLGLILPLALGLAPRFGLAAGPPADPALPESSPVVIRLSSRVLVLDYLHVNVTAIAGDSGLVLIDTNRSPAAARRLRGLIEAELGRSDFRYVVNTHGDPDHASGNAAFSDIPLVAQEGHAMYVRHGRAATRLRERARIARAQAAGGEDDAGPPRLPDVTFRDSMRLDLGDITLELRFCGEAHTDHDIVVYVPEERLLVAGDLICGPRSPCFAVDALADIPRLARELSRLLQRKEGLTTIVPGHGSALTRADLEDFRRSLVAQYATVRPQASAAWQLRKAMEQEGIEATLQRFPLPTPDHRGSFDWSEEELGRLGTRLLRAGRVREAVRVLELAVRAVPRSSWLYSCLGDARIEEGDDAAATAAYDTALAQAPDNRHAAEMLEALRGRKP
jgi:glyoxylase-like metal-dependent hydrolase (beta-lactamase superfamily II)